MKAEFIPTISVKEMKRKMVDFMDWMYAGFSFGAGPGLYSQIHSCPMSDWLNDIIYSH